MIFLRTISIPIFLWAVLFAVPTLSQAQALDSFIINQQIGSDNASPTMPGNFSVTPITTSQIDLDWDASTDNVAVTGYQIFRDAAQIATTTLTSYSDTGLTASTTYSYYVTAFDAAYNISSSTATLATSTLPVAIVSTSTPTTTVEAQRIGSHTDIRILDFTFQADETSIELSFDTNVYTQAVIRWGRTTDHELGFIASDIFKRSHWTQISGLEAGTVYEVEIALRNRSGRLSLTKTYTIKTAGDLDSTPPPNVTNFSAVRRGAIVDLNWSNPTIENFSHVRVLSSELFYPTHTADGWLVFDGTSESIIDDRILEAEAIRYYTIFVYDKAGNVSSGAIALVSPLKTESSSGDAGVTLPIPIATTTPLTIVEETKFEFSDVEFFQNDQRKSSFGGVVKLDQGRETKVAIPYELLPEHLKTIIVKFTHPNDDSKTFSLLLRINPQKTAYEASFLTDMDLGQYPIEISLFDYSTTELYVVKGNMTIKRSNMQLLQEFESGFSIMTYWRQLTLVALFILGIFFLWWWFLLGRRRDKEED